MKKIYLLLLSFVVLFSTIAKAGGEIDNKQIAGNWKITDVKITNLGSAEKKVTKDNCYLCDLYKAKLGLIFTEDGKVDYSNYGNPVEVRYTINGNVLSLYSETEHEIQTPPANVQSRNKGSRISVEFNISLVDDKLILTRISPEFTETYTFTK